MLAYIFAFELIGAFALTMILLVFDEEHTILSNPLGYAVRYALPLAALSGFIFWRLYRGHAASVKERLDIRIVSRAEEPRFVQIAEEQCTALGVRFPRFGVIEAAEPNAVTVGEGPTHGMIAVTRGLLDLLDDDELAGVLAHEASHIRQGDTRLLAANHALMRTAVMLQTNNPLRIEDWRQMLIPLLLPPMMIVLLAGSTATMLSMQLARYARRGIKLGRDHGADGEAIRVTHFPDALISALQKVGGRGVFRGSHAVEGLLFDGPADHEGGSHPAIADRLKAISALAGDLLASGRLRRDTRQPMARGFGQAGRRPESGTYRRHASGKPLEQPERGTWRHLALYFTDRPAYREWQNACIDWHEWRVGDQRNAFGLTPQAVLPVLATLAFIGVFHWPRDNDPAKFIHTFSPVTMVEIAREVNSGPFCSGPSYPDNLCPGQAPKPTFASAHDPASVAAPGQGLNRTTALGNFDYLPDETMPLFMIGLILLAFLKPDWLRTIMGEAPKKRSAPDKVRLTDGTVLGAGPSSAPADRSSARPVPAPSAEPPPRSPAGFGRKRV